MCARAPKSFDFLRPDSFSNLRRNLFANNEAVSSRNGRIKNRQFQELNLERLKATSNYGYKSKVVTKNSNDKFAVKLDSCQLPEKKPVKFK